VARGHKAFYGCGCRLDLLLRCEVLTSKQECTEVAALTDVLQCRVCAASQPSTSLWQRKARGPPFCERERAPSANNVQRTVSRRVYTTLTASVIPSSLTYLTTTATVLTVVCPPGQPRVSQPPAKLTL